MIRLRRIAVLLFIQALLTGGCSKTPLEKYSVVLDRFAAENKIELSVLTESFLDAFSTRSVMTEDSFINKNVIISEDGEHTLLVYPRTIELDVDKNFISRIEFADVKGEYIAVGNSRGFCILNKDGEIVSSYKCEGPGDIDSLLLYGENVLYSRNHEIRKYAIRNGENSIFIDQKFRSPYQKYYKTMMYGNGNNMGISSGIAGSYYISVIGCDKQSVIIKDVASSSGDFVIEGCGLYCIKGSAGRWSVYRYDLNTKKNKMLNGTGKIVNIYMGETGYVLNRGNGSDLVMYGGGSVKIPLQCTVEGVCGPGVVLKYGRKIYLIEIPVFFEKLEELKARGFNLEI